MRKKLYKVIFMIIVSIIFIINMSVNNAFAITNDDKNINFKRITVEDGLSQTSVEYLFQDSKGYMWIGTIDGLNRYNGSRFEVFRYSKDKPNSISGNYISAIAEDDEGNIWVGTSRGLNRINTHTSEITTYLPGVNGCNLSNYNITEILIDSKGDIYIATEDGLNLYNEEDDNFIRLYNSGDKKNSLSSQFVYSIVEDNYGNYWIGTDNGLNKIENNSQKIIKYYSDGGDNSINDNFIFKLYADNLDNLWIGTYNGGLNKLDLKTNKIEKFENDPNDDTSIAGNFIRYILRDSRNELWIATNNGLSRLNEEENKFINYKSKIYDPQSIVSNNVLSLFEDKSGAIWVGTYDGISLFNPQNSFKNYKNDPFNTNSLSENMMAGIYEDDEGLLWVGTVNEGLNLIDRKSGNITKFKSSDDEDSLSNNHIRDIVGIQNEIWIATEFGLNKYDKLTKKFTRYYNENSLLYNDVRTLYIDNEGILWIGTRDGLCTFDRKNTFKSYEDIFIKNGITENVFSDIIQDKDGIIWIASALDGGLIRLNKNTNEIKSYRNNEEDRYSISFNALKTIAIDSKNNIWIGSQFGLNKFDRSTEKFHRYTEDSGLSNNFIYGILIDNEDNPWMSTNYGISKFDIKNDKFVDYNVTDGLQSNEFNGYSYFKSKSGEMFFGGINGLTYFYPNQLEEKKFSPNVVIDSIYSGEKEILDISNIKIGYKNSNIQFNFFMPDYRNVSKIQYAYKLDGLDENWIFSDDRNYVSYTNLESGVYKFQVVARNSSGDWSKVTTVSFKVGMKPWQTPLAYVMYALIVSLVLYIIWNRVKILDSLVEQRTHELNSKLKENKELYDKLIKNEKYKNNYFVNLSHELRTPLNVIISTQQLITKLNEEDKDIPKEKILYYMSTLRRNSDRLLKLINNIIDTSKIESGSYKLIIEKHDIVYLVEEIVLSMKDFIEANGIELVIDPDVEEKIIECDGSEIEKCIVNLVGNAVKFTPRGGKIEVRIVDLNNKVKISVKDSGIGIEKKYHDAIFDRFGQAYNDVSEEHGGSGLGLTVTKQLVTLHNGRIFVKSEPGHGSEFVIILPVKYTM
ncbi:ligand-binding sensor domain-containing protein [Clostridium sp.]|uniref:ligand-binding sensor domain-containing protein n=1 Tax=Clostridium sp. TaxID=1506 RepID=UPI00290D4B8D|nr:two-component regulator propeller domain-containing protein [Clostridium sp.]MDU3525102.1 two-component regulator propeller domain-containing protein [Clostridium sp.]MDU6363751.1 two-component regulator propeller domain-containing protein [Clostridium sp.]